MKSNVYFSKLLTSIIMSFSMNAYALVDYSEASPESTKKDGAQNKSSTRLETSRGDSRSLIWKSDFSLSANYESREIAAEKFGVINLNTHLQTPFNVYFDISYWNAQTRSGSQNGNPKALIGFNWLRFGSPGDEARLDLYGGAKLAGSSVLSSSRNDKIFGVETTKRFGTFGLGIGFDLTMTGAPKKEVDMALGNIQRIAVSGGWMVSNDIQFELEVENFTIKESSDSARGNYLQKSVSFSCLSPKLNLNLAPGIGMEMGARFTTNKPKSDQDLKSAKLFDMHGAYSNSLFAGLNLSL